MPRLEGLQGWIEYDVNVHLSEGDPLRCAARTQVCDGIRYPRFEDDTYPHPHKPAWNPGVRRTVHVTQKQLNAGTPPGTAGRRKSTASTEELKALARSQPPGPLALAALRRAEPDEVGTLAHAAIIDVLCEKSPAASAVLDGLAESSLGCAELDALVIAAALEEEAASRPAAREAGTRSRE